MVHSYLGSLLIGLFLTLGLSAVGHATITAEFESPADGQPVAGIGTVQGFAFSDTAGVTITEVALAVDGTVVSIIPCCSERGDVAAAFSDLPAENTLNSGFGITQNFNLTSPGEHTLTLTITDSSGDQVTHTHTVTVVQAGGFEFLDQVDLSEASAERQGQDIVLSNMRIRDSASQQAVLINARLRWFRNRQGLGLVEATTVGAASTIKAARPWLTGLRKAKTSAASRAPLASVENPGNGDTVAGAALIQGFAFARRAGRSITRVQLFIDGAPFFNIPCCSDRADVAAAFPSEPNALNSGFGVTFNYGLLSSGVHQLLVEIEDSAGDIHKITKGILVKRPGEFEFLEDLDFSAGSVRIANGAIVVEGAVAQSNVTGETVSGNLRYRFQPSLQGFQLLEEYIEEVVVTNILTVINGDTSSVSALKVNDGGDGISFPEAIEAVNNTAEGERILVTFITDGILQIDSSVPMQRPKVTIDGDVDGDGAPDVTLEEAQSPATSGSPVQAQSDGTGGLLTVTASSVTLRGLTIRNVAETAVEILASPGMSIADVTVLGLEVDVQPAQGQASAGDGIVVRAQAETDQEAHLSAVLVSGNRIRSAFNSMTISALGVNSAAEGLTIRGVTVAENEIMEGRQDIQIRPADAQGALLTQIAITNNTMSNAEFLGILVTGGVSPTAGDNGIEALVTDNMVTGAELGIALTGGGSGADRNILEVMVADNVVQGGRGGILLDGGNGASNNTLMSHIRGNQLQDTGVGIGLTGGFSRAENNMLEVVVVDNMVKGGDAGINLQGGNASTNNTLLVDIRGNELQDTAVVGIGLTGGFSRGGINRIDAVVAENEVKGAGFGIVLAGGVESSPQNIVLGEVQENTVQDSQSDGLFQIGGWFSGENMVDAMITDNVVMNSGSNGVEATGGTTRSRSDVVSNSPAIENLVTGMILGNSVQDNALTGIAVFGGFDDTNGG